jgi:hypothetical protein
MSPAIAESVSGPPVTDMNRLNSQQIADNYHRGYDLALQLIRSRQRALGFSGLDLPDDVAELAQSVFGCESLVQLIQTTPFDADAYTAVIQTEIDELARSLFPDVGKRHFVSLDKLHDEYDVQLEMLPEEDAWSPEPGISESTVLDYLRGKISDDNYRYLVRLMTASEETRDFSWNDKIYHLIDQSLEFLESRISNMRKLYPNGLPAEIQDIRSSDDLSDDDIVECYKYVFLGLRRRFPVHFLNHDTLHRCAVLARYAVEHIFEVDPLTVLRQRSADELAAVGLRGVVRHFNYSINRLIRNAYPGLLLPWEESHVEDGFWHDGDNRRMAVRWLVEEKLGIPRNEIPAALREDRIRKSTFLQHGLSYMFAQYYKSVSRAIGDAYPHLMPWELGSVPNSFWQGEEGRQNIVRAIQWMIRRMEIPLSAIPAKIKDRTLSRETFKHHGLSTVFERIFKKNMYQAINTAFPGVFEIWEIGKVPPDYWENMIQAYKAALWVSHRERIPPEGIAKAIRTRRLRKETFIKYGLGGMLKSVFDNDVWKAYLPYILPKREYVDVLMRDVILLAVLHKQMRKIESTNSIVRALRSMFFRPLLSEIERQQLRLYKRIKKRIRHRMGEMTTLVMEEI